MHSVLELEMQVLQVLHAQVSLHSVMAWGAGRGCWGLCGAVSVQYRGSGWGGLSPAKKLYTTP